MNRITRLFFIVALVITFSLRSALGLPNSIGWWNFDEGTGTLTADSSGNGNTGTVGGSWITNGLSSNAMTFTTSQFTTIPYWSGFNLSNSISLSIWINPSAPGLPGPGFSQIFAKGNGYFGDWQLLYCDGSNVQFQATGMNGNSISSISHVAPGLWTHIAATFDGTTAKLYINGLLDCFTTWSGTCLFTTNGIQIGNMAGAIDDARVYSNALTEIQVAQLFLEHDSDLDRLVDANEAIVGTNPNNPDTDGDGFPDGMEVMARTDPLNSSSFPDVTTGLVGWWKLDEGSGTFTADSTTNGDDGTLHLGPAWVTGIHSNALQFDGTERYVVCGVGGSSSPLAVTNLTISLWAYVTNTMQDAVLVDRSYSASGYSMSWEGTYDDILMVLPNIPSISISLYDVATNVWNHFAFTYDGSNVNCYLNGCLYSSGSYTDAIGSSIYPLFIGQSTVGTLQFQGIIDDVRIYNRALAAGDVVALALVDTYGTGLPDIQKFQMGLNPNAASTTGDGIPDDWAVKYGLNPLDPTVAGQTSTQPFTHGLSNLQVYQNQSVLIADNYSTLGDGIADWWKVTYSFSLTDTNVASADPENDNLTNLQKYQLGLNPFVSYILTMPPGVVANSSGNSGSVPSAGSGASYSWTIANGTIDSGSGTPNVSWTAGTNGTATLSVLLTTLGGSFTSSGSAVISPCVLPTSFTVSSNVIAGSSGNVAFLPSPLITLNSMAFSNGPPLGVIQGNGSDSNFYGDIDEEYDDAIFKMTPSGTITVFYRFTPTIITNGYASAAPIQGSGSDTNFYGVNYLGGGTEDFEPCLGLSPWYGFGTVYKLTPQGTLTTLHVFSGPPDGANPSAGLIRGSGSDSNFFYGVTSRGGTNLCSLDAGCCLGGNGTIFRISATNGGSYSVLYHFSGGADGGLPVAGLTLSADGYLYGTTSSGSTNPGTVFRINTNGTSFLTIHQFSGGADGGSPSGGLIQGSDGFIYGTTFYGGITSSGTVFKVSTNSSPVFTNMHQFSGVDGNWPSAGMVQGFDGNFYGTTLEGGTSGYGTIFRMTPQGTLTTVYQFTGGADGGWPDVSGDVAGKGLAANSFDGYLYGTTVLGGTYGNGTVYKISPASYAWSINNGTITSDSTAYSIQWTAGDTGPVSLCVTVTLATGCSTVICTNIPVTAANEWYGPFVSWTNVAAFGAMGGTNDDTAAIQRAFTTVGSNNCSTVIYCPSTYRISQTITVVGSKDKYIKICGADNTKSGFIWAGGSDTIICGTTTMFKVDGVAESKFERLFFDGQGKSYTLVNEGQSIGQGNFDQGNVWKDCVFKNSAPGGFGVVGGWFDTNAADFVNMSGMGFADTDWVRCVWTNCGAAMMTGNQNALDAWVTQSYITDCSTGLYADAGSIHPYCSTFVDNGTDIVYHSAINYSSAVGNTSYHSYCFYNNDVGGNCDSTSTPIFGKGNTVIDPGGPAFAIAEVGPVILLDNLVTSTNNPLVLFSSCYNVTNGINLLALGNTNCFSTFVTYAALAVPSKINMVDNGFVSRSSLSLSIPTMPLQATNLNRAVVEMGTNFTVSTLQSAINGAMSGTMIHFPTSLYVNNPSAPFQFPIYGTITLPTNAYLIIVGDGNSSKLAQGNDGQTLFSAPFPSHATFSDFDLFGNQNRFGGALVQVSNISTSAARVYVRDSNLMSGTFANIDLGNCPNSIVDYRGYVCGSTYNASWGTQSNGVNYLLEGAGTVRIFDTDSSDNVLGFCVTNGGSVYGETIYNEAGAGVTGDRCFFVSNGSTLTLMAGIQHENYSGGCCPWNYATTNSFTVSNLTGQVSMNLIGGIIDYTVVDTNCSGIFWINGCTTTHAETWTCVENINTNFYVNCLGPSTSTNSWPLIDPFTYHPVQTMNWNNPDASSITPYSDVGSMNAAAVRAGLAPSRGLYSDFAPMGRRTNQTDVLIEGCKAEEGGINIQISR